MHYEDTQAEIHKLVVGPMDNNVYVLRCKQTGDAVLLDAANEHEKLLDLCRRLGVRKVLETHGHWDHIQAVPAVRDAGYEVGVTAADASMLPSYDFVLRGRFRDRGGPAPAAHHPDPRAHAGLHVLPAGGIPGPVQRRHPLSRRPGGHHFPGGDFPTIIRSIEDRLFSKLPADTMVMPGHGTDTTIGAESPHLQEWIDRGW